MANSQHGAGHTAGDGTSPLEEEISDAEAAVDTTGASECDAETSVTSAIQTPDCHAPDRQAENAAPPEGSTGGHAPLPDGAATGPIAGDETVWGPDSTETACSASEDDGEAPERKKPKRLGPRWSYLITRGTVVAVVWAFFAFLFDPLIRQGLITAGQQVARARVDIDALHTRLFPPEISLTGVAVANARKPGTNLIQFESLTADVDGLALSRGAYVINRAVVTGVTWDTQRSDSGLLPDAEPAEESESDSPDFSKYGRDWAKGVFERARLEYDPRHLESVRLADRLEDEWKREFAELESRARRIDEQYQELEDLLKVARGGNPLKKLETYRRVAEDSRQLLQNVELVRRDLQQMPSRATGDLGALNEARKRDQQEIKRKVKELVVDPDRLSEFLLGPELHHQVSTALSWLRWANRTTDSFRGRKQPNRQRGEDVLFPRDEQLPDWLIRLTEFSGSGRIAGDDLWIEGTVTDVSSDPVLHGRPSIIRVQGRGTAAVQLKGVLDRTAEVPRNEFDLTCEFDSESAQQLGDPESLAIDVAAEQTRWTVRLRTTGDELSGRVVLIQEPVKLTPQVSAEADEAIRRILNAAVADIDRVEAEAALSGTLTRPQIRLSTSLGPAIANGVRRGLGREVSAQQDALVAELNQRMQERDQKLRGLFNDRYRKLFADLNGKQDLIRNLMPNVADRRLDPGKLFR